MRPWRLIGTVAAVAAFSAVIASQTPSGHAVFEQALAKERVDGNLQEAIKLYERVVAEFASDRALAARALVQVGRCYEKLGRDEAVRAYERLVRDFANQEDAVELARARLASLKRPPPDVAGPSMMPGVRSFPRVDGTNLVHALSPDGTKAAFMNLDKGQNLAVYDATSQRTTMLTNFDWATAWVDHAVWAPDGRRIAYMQCDMWPCGLRVVTVGGESKEIFRNDAGAIMPAGWLPDGSALVVMLGRADRTFSIGLIPETGGPFTPLRSLSLWPGPYPELPSLSSDGRLIAFADGASAMRDIHVIGRDGRTAHRITDHPADDHRPLWSPDGRHLAFLSNRNGSEALWMVALKDGQPAGEPVRVKDGMQDTRLLAWTARGLAYAEIQRTDDIYLVPVDPVISKPNGAPQMIPYGRTGHNVAPEWSPDGKYLAFVSRAPGRHTLVLLPSGGAEPREFTLPNQTTVWGLRWFGDSRGLGFTGYDAKGEPTVFRLTLATGEWRTVPLPAPMPNNNRIEWNADGSRYFYPRANFAGDGPAIVEHDLQSGRERIVFRGKSTDFRYRALRFSPDRRFLAMNEMPPDPAQPSRIVVLDLETGQTAAVYGSPAGETFPVEALTWSPSGRALLVRTEKGQRAMSLRLVPVDGGEVRLIPLGAELTRLLSPGRNSEKPSIESLVWSPDGSRLAFNLRASRLETFVIENPLALAGAADARSRR